MPTPTRLLHRPFHTVSTPLTLKSLAMLDLDQSGEETFSAYTSHTPSQVQNGVMTPREACRGSLQRCQRNFASRVADLCSAPALAVGLFPCPVDRLVGLVVRRPPRERKIPGSNPASAGIFAGSSHTSDFKIGTPVATLPCAWHYRVSAGTGRPGVSIL